MTSSLVGQARDRSKPALTPAAAAGSRFLRAAARIALSAGLGALVVDRWGAEWMFLGVAALLPLVGLVLARDIKARRRAVKP